MASVTSDLHQILTDYSEEQSGQNIKPHKICLCCAIAYMFIYRGTCIDVSSSWMYNHMYWRMKYIYYYLKYVSFEFLNLFPFYGSMEWHETQFSTRLSAINYLAWISMQELKMHLTISNPFSKCVWKINFSWYFVIQ